MAATEKSTDAFEKDFEELQRRCQVLVQEEHVDEQIFSEGSLRRFLRAFVDVDLAFKRLIKCNIWRSEFCVSELSPEDPDIAKELTTGKAHILRNRDSRGRPVIYVAARKHNAYDRDIEKLKKFLVYILESACKRCDETIIDNLLLVFDLKGFTLACMDYQFVKNLIWILSHNYPERLGACLIINSPLIFSGCWTVIRPWLNDVTASKVKFVHDERELCQYINPDALPPEDC